MECEKCAGWAPAWMGGAHKCAQDFTRRRYVEGSGWLEVPEPHRYEDWLAEYDKTHHLGHNFPSYAWPDD